jgi:branched-chain amino acid transport system substrate-binding protein
MRPEDHQIIQDIHISVHTDQDIVIDGDNSGFGLLTESTVTAAGMDSATTCQMERPES